MRRARSARLIVTTTGVAAAVVAMSFAGTAWAGGPKPPKAKAVVCGTLTGTTTGSQAVAGCSGQGGSGNFSGGLSGVSGTAQIVWASGGTTTFTYSGTPIVTGKKDKCGTGNIEFPLAGAVTANTGFPTGNGGVKGPVKVKVCVNGTTAALSTIGAFKL